MITMPWNKLFITDVPVQSGCADCRDTNEAGAGSHWCGCPPKGETCSALGLVKAHWNPEDFCVAKVYVPAFLLLSRFYKK